MVDQAIIEVTSNAIMTIILVAAMPLLFGLTVGLVMSIFQTVTSIQEQTLAFIPKIIGVFVAILLFGPFMLNLLKNLLEETYMFIPYFINL
jgi:flagellar biosynthetic protein FliQ